MPLQAERPKNQQGHPLKITRCFACLVVLELTEFLLDNLEDFLLVKLLWKTLDSGQGLATISLCTSVSDILYYLRVSWLNERTLDTDMDVVLRRFRLPDIFVGFGERVC